MRWQRGSAVVVWQQDEAVRGSVIAVSEGCSLVFPLLLCFTHAPGQPLHAPRRSRSECRHCGSIHFDQRRSTIIEHCTTLSQSIVNSLCLEGEMSANGTRGNSRRNKFPESCDVGFLAFNLLASHHPANDFMSDSGTHWSIYQQQLSRDHLICF